jgi:predicted component of type VI protein secretion system
MIPAGGTPPPAQSQPPQPQPASAPPAAAGGKLKLVSQTHGFTIEASDGDILGRSKGQHAGVLGRFSTISGTHCKVIKTPAGWSIQDMGSTNGTFYNGSRLAANTSVPLQNNTKVKLADVELLISFDADGGAGTSRI